ncbi:RdgB/HAM1 family non-canonical purine NTP pyrophosphatase [Luethyella okanaganae]|uniref:dITP/XTP pyrophosphatase n=1 Tax=Luethyella okanaganae TaxID=69372 RepID=A0ABW1VAU6_9MICO
MALELVLATHNRHKVDEFQRILGAVVPELLVHGYDGPEPVEDGVSFAENALIKARAASEHTGRIALADDSGLCVDVMGGAPGIFSARWAGAHGDGAANLALLLDQLGDIRDPHRTARFVCVIALAVPDAGAGSAEHVVVGEWSGHLATEPCGSNGFGYDPIFVPDGFAVTAAELAPHIKNDNSHRARAIANLVPLLRDLVG